MPETMKKRRWYVAGLLSLLTTGLGQIYNGQPRKGLILLFFLFLYSFIPNLAMQSFPGLLITLTYGIVLFGYSICDAILVAFRKTEIEIQWFNRAYIYVSVLVIKIFIMQPLLPDIYYENFNISSADMAATMIPGDKVCAILRVDADKLQFKDILVVIQPNTDLRLSKRLIGLPGDTITIQEKQVWRNGGLLAEPYAQFIDDHTINHTCPAPPSSEMFGCPCRDNISQFTVPAGHYFLMGDNRDVSKDSRCFGLVPKDNIIGKVLYVYFSKDPGGGIRFDRIGKTF